MPAEPLNITIALKDESGPAPPPRPPPATPGGAGRGGGWRGSGPEGWDPDLEDDEFTTEREAWRGKYAPFQVDRGTAKAHYAGEAIGQFRKGNLKGAASSALKTAALHLGEGRGASGTAAFLEGAGAGAKLAGIAGVAVGALTKFAEWVKKSSDALEDMAKRYGAFSPQVSVAMAERDVKQTMFEMNQAEKYGQQLAEQVNARTDLSIEFEKLTDSFTMFFAPLTTMIEEGLAGILKGLNELIGNTGGDEFKQLNQLLDKQMEQMLDLQRDAELQAAQAAAAAGVAPVQQWMMGAAEDRRKRRERERKGPPPKHPGIIPIK